MTSKRLESIFNRSVKAQKIVHNWGKPSRVLPPDEESQQNEVITMFAAIVDQLPEAHRMAFCARFHAFFDSILCDDSLPAKRLSLWIRNHGADFSVAEVARKLGVTRQRVYQLAEEARKKLAAMLPGGARV